MTPQEIANMSGAENTYEKLVSQILSQGTTSKWSGEGKGSVEANARDMARILFDIGITDINQFGQFETTVNKQQKVVPEYQTIDVGDSTQTIATGRYYIPEYTNVGDSEVMTGKQYVDPSSVTKSYAVNGDTESTTYTTSIPTQQQTYGNKLTGQAVPSSYGERQTGNAWGGTFSGSGNTGYRVQFGPNGTPVFYTTGASSNDLATILEDPLLNLVATVGATYFGGPLGAGALELAKGNDFGDAAKAAALAYASSDAAKGLFGGTAAAGDVGAAGSATANAAADASFIAADAAQLAAQGIGESQIASTLGSYGVSTGAANLAASMAINGLTEPVISQQLNNLSSNTGLFSQSSDAAAMKDFYTADAKQLAEQTGNNVAAIEQNLIAAGMDPLDAASYANAAVMSSAAPKAASPEMSDWDNITKYLPDVLGMLGTIGAAGAFSQPQQTVAPPPMPTYKPQDSMPSYSPEYYQQIQDYYTGYMPQMPRDVATPLQDWYSSGYSGPDATTKKLFGG